jgi:hypothetical protein
MFHTACKWKGFAANFKKHQNTYNISGVIYEVIKELSGRQVHPPVAVAICELGSGSKESFRFP